MMARDVEMRAESAAVPVAPRGTAEAHAAKPYTSTDLTHTSLEVRAEGAANADDQAANIPKPKKERAGPRKRRPKKQRRTPATHGEGEHSGAADKPDKPAVPVHSLSLSLPAGATLGDVVTDVPSALCPSAQPFSPLNVAGSEPVGPAAYALSSPLRSTRAVPRLGLYKALGTPPRISSPPSAASREDGRAQGRSIYEPPDLTLPGRHDALDTHTKAPPGRPQRSLRSDSRDEDDERSERAYWTQWVIEAAEKERARRLNVLRQLQMEEEGEIRRRRQWAIEAIEKEQEAMMREMFLDNMKNTQWFQSTISRFSKDYEVVCPNSWFGCTFSCMLKDLEQHLESCVYRQVPDTLDQVVEEFADVDFYSYDVVCPNAVLGCKEICSRENLAQHLATCPVNGISREKEWEERLEWRRSVILASEQERERRMDELSASNGAELSFGHLQRLYEEQTAMLQVVLHDEIVDFYQHAQQEALSQRCWVVAAISKVKREMAMLWGDATHVEGYGSFVTGLYGTASDVDLVVFGVTDTHHLSCQQCVSLFASHLQTTESAVEFTEISALTRASIPLLKVVVVVTIEEVGDSVSAADGSHSPGQATSTVRIPFDITFDAPDGIWHNGVASATLVNTLATHFYGMRELAMVLKHFLVKRSLNDPYVGGLSSYGLLLMLLFILQEQNAVVLSPDGLHDGVDAGSGLAIASTAVGEVECGKPADPTSPNSYYNARCEAQRHKGEAVAREIIRQSVLKQEQRQQLQRDDGAAQKSVRRKKRPVLPTLLTGTDGEHEKKPYLLGKLLMDFLHFYGNDFRQSVDQVCVLSREDVNDTELLDVIMAMPSPIGTRSLHASPSHGSTLAMASSPLGQTSQRSPVPMLMAIPSRPLDSPPAAVSAQDGVLVIHDPLQLHNNVGKSCYRVSQVFRELSDFLSFLTALIVRGSVMTTGKKLQTGNSAATSAEGATSSASVALSTHHQAPASSPRTSPHTTAAAATPSYRILMSVFEMKSREKRSSMDFAERLKEPI